MRGCGATVDFNSQLSVLAPNSTLPDSVGNLAAVGGLKSIQVRWVSDSQLEVSLLASERVFRRESEAFGVQATYLVRAAF